MEKENHDYQFGIILTEPRDYSRRLRIQQERPEE